jgi:hypothetical protein
VHNKDLVCVYHGRKGDKIMRKEREEGREGKTVTGRLGCVCVRGAERRENRGGRGEEGED